jgi:hypothetical protein
MPAMFSRIIFKNQPEYGPLIDIGSLAEALLFYGHVSIIANTATIKYLLKRIPPLVFLQLVRSERVSLYYLNDQIGVRTTERQNALPLHNLVAFSSPEHRFDNAPARVFHEMTHNMLESRRFAKAVKPINHTSFDQQAVLSSFDNHDVIEPTVNTIIHTIAPNYLQSEAIRFRVERENQGIVIDTNIDFSVLNTCYHQAVPKEHSSITPAYLLSLIQSMQEELYFAGQLDSEIAVSALSREMHTQTLNSILNRRFKSEKQIEAFANLTLDSGHAIREAVNSGKVQFSDVVKLLDKADKFREWLEQQPSDEDLIKRYYHAIIENSWVEKLPGKATKWGIFTSAAFVIDMTVAGGVGTSVGVALGMFDTFLFDRIAGGWKPHHFVEGELGELFMERPKSEKS